MKEQYNALLLRYAKAELYFDNTSVTLEDKEKHLDAFMLLVAEINKMASMIPGITEDEILNGFYFETGSN
jgi:hypothetical protein